MLFPTHGTAFVHIGTHKTGTTSLQVLLAANDALLREAGVFVPQAGRTAPGSAGHHNLAWELRPQPHFDPWCGTFEMMLREAAYVSAQNVCLTSEEFEFLSFNDAALRRLRDGFLAIGYRPKIIVYLRPQCDYLESLYAEICRDWDIAFEDFVETIIATGFYGQSWFEYQQLVGAFANVFGREHVIVRPYRAAAPAAALLREFVGIIAPGLDFERLVLPERMNPMPAFSEVVAARERRLSGRVRHSMGSAQRFDPLSVLDIVRLCARFQRSNEAIAKLYGARIGCVTPATLAREAITELFRDRASGDRKRLLRALVASAADIAA